MADEVVTELTPQEMVDWANAALDREREQQEEIERLRKLVLDGDTTIGGPRAALWKDNERLRTALERAREAIAQAPEDAFGSVPPAHDHPGYWIRDELVDDLTKALHTQGHNND